MLGLAQGTAMRSTDIELKRQVAGPSSRIEDSTSGDPPREIPMGDIVFRIASLVVIGLIYGATAWALWEMWRVF